MVADVRIKDNSVQVRKSLQKVSRQVPKAIKRALANATAFEIAAIKERTQSKGIDFRGRAFKPYSPKYKRRLVKQSGVVDLTDTGQMFSSLTSKVTPSKGELFFRQASANRKAFFHDEAGAGRKKWKESFLVLQKMKKQRLKTYSFLC